MHKRSALAFRIIVLVCILCAAGLLAFSIAEEQPKGTLKGIVTAKESGVPLKASVTVATVVDNDSYTIDYKSTKSDKNGRFILNDLPVGTYELSIASTAHRMKPISVKIEEGKAEEIAVELTPDAPYMDLYVHQHVFTPDERAQVTCSGFLKENNIAISIYKVNMARLMGPYEANLRRLITMDTYYGYGENVPIKVEGNPGLSYVDKFTSPIKNKDQEGVFTYRIDMPKMAPGLYVVSAGAGKVKRVDWFLFTSVGMVVKGAAGKLLAFTTDLKTGKPIPGCEVQVYSQGNRTNSLKTDAAGLVSTNLTPAGEHDSSRNIVAIHGDSIAFTSAWLANTSNTSMLLYSYTDRPVYRPNQQIYFKGIARRPDGTNYKTPFGSNVIVQVQDPMGTLIYKTSVKTGKFGSFDGSFTLPKDCATGYYSIEYTIDGESVVGSAGFRIAEYRKPVFTASIEFDKERYTRNQMVKAKVSTEYYFGTPVVNAVVNYSVSRGNYWRHGGDDDDSLFVDEGYDSADFGEFIQEGSVQTNDKGEAEIEFPAIWPQSKNKYSADIDQQFQLNIFVTDRTNQEANTRASVIATSGDIALSIETDKYIVQPGDTVKLRVKAFDYNNKPVANQQVDLKIGKEKWDEDGYQFIERESRKVTTNTQGEADIEIKTKDPEDLFVYGETRDKNRNRIRAVQSVWVFSSAWVSDIGSQLPDLKITTDKKEYSAGENMTALISTSKPGTTALVTVEGEKIFDHFTVRLENNVTKVTIPVKSDYKPNFFLGICYIKNKRMIAQEAGALVSTKSEKLNLTVKTDKDIYQPGSTVNATITAKNANGKPVVSEVSLGIVDEAIYAIAEDRTTPIDKYFYARKPNLVRTVFSFPEIYLSDPDKAGARKETTVRKNFKDTAYWSPAVVTDSNGTAKLSFKLPDNITTWRATARAMTSNSTCGETKSTFIARKDLMVRLEMPRFLTAGDSTTITAAIHNYTPSAEQVDVKLEAEVVYDDANISGLDVTKNKIKLAANDIKTRTAMQKKVTVKKDSDLRLDWDISLTKPGMYTFRISAVGKRNSDAVEIPLEVIPHGIYRDTYKAGTISGSRTALEEFSVRRDAALGNTQLKITLQPSMYSLMMPSLEYLANYPYGCTEQTASAFLPDVILWQNMGHMGPGDSSLRAALPDMVQKGLIRLQRMQRYNGSWGWSEYGEADLWMTSYVTYAFMMAKQAGFTVNPEMIDNALYALDNMASNANNKPDDRAYAYYALALGGRDVSAALQALIESKNLGAGATAMAALAFNRLPDSSQSARAMYNRLLDMAVVDDGLMHWEGSSKYGYLNVQETAFALKAMLEFDPYDSRCSDVVRWLMLQRQGSIWFSTRDTAITLDALSRYLVITQELRPDYSVNVYLNGSKIKSVRFDSSSLYEPPVVIYIDGKELAEGNNKVQVDKTGAGNLYYTINLQQYIESEKMLKIAGQQGPAITRTYYKPSPRYFQTGSARDLGSPVTSCKEGDIVMVKLKIQSDSIYDYLLLEDRLPAGFEVIERGPVNYWDWSHWYSAVDIRDKKVSFYIERLGKSTYSVEYQMRAMAKGKYAAMPAEIFGMYRPEVRVGTLEGSFTVK